MYKFNEYPIDLLEGCAWQRNFCDEKTLYSGTVFITNTLTSSPAVGKPWRILVVKGDDPIKIHIDMSATSYDIQAGFDPNTVWEIVFNCLNR